MVNGGLPNGGLNDRKDCGFHIWYPKTMRSSHGAKLILLYEKPTGSNLTSLFSRNLEIQRSTFLLQTPKKIKPLSLNAEEYGQTMTRHRSSSLHGAGIMEDYFLLIFNTHISFQSCNRRSTIDVRRYPRQHLLKQVYKWNQSEEIKNGNTYTYISFQTIICESAIFVWRSDIMEANVISLR